MIVFVALSEFQVLPVLEAHVFASRQNQRIVTPSVKSARGRAEEKQGVVEHVARAIDFRSCLQPARKASVFLTHSAAFFVLGRALALICSNAVAVSSLVFPSICRIRE